MKDNLRLIITCVVSLISNYVSYMTTMIKQIMHTHTHKHTHTQTHTHTHTLIYIYTVDERHRQDTIINIIKD